ncbi:SCO1 protein [Polaromonas vacuolata]|uniref:SCO1 protein n=1 Tax=Polaromonas vacuolata TaxID=37448 RepID=A0A6H2HBH6_9BURK|nr:SCO family protein [Polaromonas vacuolata]QJC57117.1 SCO1 protein [Polaromonas vacuolata]
MFKTAFISAVMALAAWAASSWLTHDYQVWTAEGARRLEVALNPVASPAVMLDGPGLRPQLLSHYLADGKSITLLDFVYTRCQTVCLSLGSVYQQMQAQLQQASLNSGQDQHVKLLSISFDGEHDNPKILKAYAARMNAETSLWRFARVANALENQRLLDAFEVVVVADDRGEFEHNAALLLIDEKGNLMRIFDYAEQQLALDYARYLAARITP